MWILRLKSPKLQVGNFCRPVYERHFVWFVNKHQSAKVLCDSISVHLKFGNCWYFTDTFIYLQDLESIQIFERAACVLGGHSFKRARQMYRSFCELLRLYWRRLNWIHLNDEYYGNENLLWCPRMSEVDYLYYFGLFNFSKYFKLYLVLYGETAPKSKLSIVCAPATLYLHINISMYMYIKLQNIYLERQPLLVSFIAYPHLQKKVRLYQIDGGPIESLDISLMIWYPIGWFTKNKIGIFQWDTPSFCLFW